jgi:hypothetical protein
MYALCNVIYLDQRFVPLRKYFRLSAKCPARLFSVVIWCRVSKYVVQKISELFWDSSSCSYYHWDHFCFYTLYKQGSYCKLFGILKSLLLLSWSHAYLLKLQCLLTEIVLFRGFRKLRRAIIVMSRRPCVCPSYIPPVRQYGTTRLPPDGFS